jgi:hypothetical protein
MRRNDDTGILQAALLGYQQQLDEINAKIAELRRRLGGRSSASSGSAAPAPRAQQKKHRISAEGRARIAAAQRRRWAAAKKNAS